jgi:hypothetical protein
MAGVFENFPYTNFHDLNLDWVLNTLKSALLQIDVSNGVITTLTTKCDGLDNEVKLVNSMITSINTELGKIEKGEYVTLYLNSIVSWIDNNLQQLVSKIVKYVAFYLDDTGHFCADIPETWDFLTFDSVADTDNADYGKLILEW